MPVPEKPSTVRSSIVTSLTGGPLGSIAPRTQMPDTSGDGWWQGCPAGVSGGISTVPCLPVPLPRRVMSSCVIVRFSRNSPGATVIVSPGSASSIAAWIDSPGCTTPSEAPAGAAPPRNAATTLSPIANIRGRECIPSSFEVVETRTVESAVAPGPTLTSAPERVNRRLGDLPNQKRRDPSAAGARSARRAGVIVRTAVAGTLPGARDSRTIQRGVQPLPHSTWLKQRNRAAGALLLSPEAVAQVRSVENASVRDGTTTLRVGVNRYVSGVGPRSGAESAPRLP